jgi:hypothetical protein
LPPIVVSSKAQKRRKNAKQRDQRELLSKSVFLYSNGLLMFIKPKKKTIQQISHQVTKFFFIVFEFSVLFEQKRLSSSLFSPPLRKTWTFFTTFVTLSTVMSLFAVNISILPLTRNMKGW